MSAPKLQKIISAMLRRIQELNDSLNDVHRQDFVDEATGIHLDGLGSIVGQPRNGLPDADYRLMIRARIAANMSSGTYADLVRVFQAALGEQTEITFKEYGLMEAEAIISSASVSPSQVDVLRALKAVAKLSGTRLLLLTDTTGTPEGGTNAFRFAGGAGAARGFGVGQFRSVG